MDHKARVLPGRSPPTTPKRDGPNPYQDLLLRFGSQSSATSATKARRELSISTPPTYDLCPSKSHGQDQHATVSSPAAPSPPLDSVSLSPNSREGASSKCSSVQTPATRDTGKLKRGQLRADNLVQSPRQGRRTTPSVEHREEELKMEKWRRERTAAPRRSGRARQSDILASDTTANSSTMIARHVKQERLPRKLDTARARLRDDIARKTKYHADNFFVANKDLFLPLLPANNYVSKLVAKHACEPIEEYRRLLIQPTGVTATMKPYQLEGLSFLVHLYNNGVSGILGDEMGLGKTLQTLSLFQYLEEQDTASGVVSEESRPYLVICPLSVLNSWITEAQRWVPQLKVLRFHGTAAERTRLKRVAFGIEDQAGNETVQSKYRKNLRKAGTKASKTLTDASSDSYKIIVTTYDTYQAEQAWFKHSFVWRYVVLDEGHKIKSNSALISRSLRTVTSEFRLILTGTPLQNNLTELWALLAWLYPEVFTEPTEQLFKESFDLNRGRVNRQTMDDARRLLEVIMLRRMKSSPVVDLGLPPKEEILLYVPLTPMQRFWYTRLLTKVDNALLEDVFVDGKKKERAALDVDRKDDVLLHKMEQLQQTLETQKDVDWDETAQIMREALDQDEVDSSAGAWRKLMNLVMQLRKCCSHPYLLPNATPSPYYIGQHVIQASGKFILLEKLLRNSVFTQGKKVLIFSGFTRTLDFCEDILAMISSFGQDFKHLRLDGSTGRARRNLDIRLFNDMTSDYKVMLLSTRAGGLGINLTSAEDVIFLDEDWNPQITLQAEARAHRIGQTKKVTIYKICTQGTVEEQMMGRIRKKLYLSAKITESMKSIHSDDRDLQAKGRGPDTTQSDAPEMTTTQLKSLVRRGAQTLSHPEIDISEMLSWNLDTMMSKCRDSVNDALLSEGDHAEDAEEKWLSMMERVECAVFDGKRYHRQTDKSASTSTFILPENITRKDRRKGKNTTVMLNGFAINKESLQCADWEAVPTFAGKDPQLASPPREKRRDIAHEEHCTVCFESINRQKLKQIRDCKGCPRSYHIECLDPAYQLKARDYRAFYCPQHTCNDCGKNTNDAGSLMYRCRWCPRAFCEDCLGGEELISDNLPEYEILGEPSNANAYYIKCAECVNTVATDEQHKKWMQSMEMYYAEQHSALLEQRREDQQIWEQQDTMHAVQKSGADEAAEVADIVSVSTASPPALTDASLSGPTPDESRVGTPRLEMPPRIPGKRVAASSFDLSSDFPRKRRKVDL